MTWRVLFISGRERENGSPWVTCIWVSRAQFLQFLTTYIGISIAAEQKRGFNRLPFTFKSSLVFVKMRRYEWRSGRLTREPEKMCLKTQRPERPIFRSWVVLETFFIHSKIYLDISQKRSRRLQFLLARRNVVVFSLLDFDFYIILWWDYGTFSGIFFFHSSSSDFGVCWKDHMASCTKCFIDDIILTRLTEVPSRSWSVEKKSLTSGWENRKKKIVNVFSLPCDFDMNKKKLKV